MCNPLFVERRDSKRNSANCFGITIIKPADQTLILSHQYDIVPSLGCSFFVLQTSLWCNFFTERKHMFKTGYCDYARGGIKPPFVRHNNGHKVDAFKQTAVSLSLLLRQNKGVIHAGHRLDCEQRKGFENVFAKNTCMKVFTVTFWPCYKRAETAWHVVYL